MSRTLLGILDFTEAKRIRAELRERGVELEFLNNPETCTTGGCAPTVEVYTTESDLPKVREFLQAERAKLFGGLDAKHEIHEQVFDTEKETAICPACGTEFKTAQLECPDCGLVFASEEAEPLEPHEG